MPSSIFIVAGHSDSTTNNILFLNNMSFPKNVISYQFGYDVHVEVGELSNTGYRLPVLPATLNELYLARVELV